MLRDQILIECTYQVRLIEAPEIEGEGHFGRFRLKRALQNFKHLKLDWSTCQDLDFGNN